MSNVYKNLHPARDRFYKAQDPQGAYRLLEPLMAKANGFSPEEKRALYELAGLVLRAQGKYQAAIGLYDKIGDTYQAGYCALLTGNLKQVQAYWTQTLHKRTNHWCLSLYGLVTQQLNAYPTLFQIRNHVESDIGNLIQAQQGQFLVNLVSYVDFLGHLNLETPKFMGRAFLNAGMLEQAGPLLLKGQKSLPNDPEIYYHLGQYNVACQNPEKARLMLNQCLLISPFYSPAKELLESL